MGPPKSAGPGAAMGFAKKNSVTVDALATEVTPRGDYYALRRAIAGREAAKRAQTRDQKATMKPAVHA